MALGAPLNPKDTLRMLRTVWAGLLGGQVLFVGTVAWLQSGHSFKPMPELAGVFFQTAMWGLIIFTPVAYLIRIQLYKRHWKADAVAPRGYFLGNLILFIVCETISLLGLVAVLLTGQMRSVVVMLPLLALAIMVVNFPNGKPMEPRGPDLLHR